MEVPGYWDLFSISSKKALQWAAAMASLRNSRGSDASGQTVDVFDLFVGILLANPDDSEAGILQKNSGSGSWKTG